jgi:hypothetical protein
MYQLSFTCFVKGADLPKIPGGTAIAYKVENALKSH